MAQSKSELLAEKQRIEDALSAHRAERIAALRAEIEELADDDGVSCATFIQEHISGKEPPRKAPQRGVLPAKYVSPNDRAVTWSGAGKQPAWFTAALAEGYTREMLEVPTTTRANGNGAHA